MRSNILSHKTKQKWLFWKSFVYLISSSKIWQALLRYQDNINIHLRTPNNHPEEQEMGKYLAECTLNVVHFWTSKKDPILNPRFSSPWYPAENYPSSSTSLDTWHPDAYISSKCHWLDQWKWMFFLSEQPWILSEDGKKKQPDRAHPCTKSFNKPLMTFRKNFPLKHVFFQLSFVGHLDEFSMKSHGPWPSHGRNLQDLLHQSVFVGSQQPKRGQKQAQMHCKTHDATEKPIMKL